MTVISAYIQLQSAALAGQANIMQDVRNKSFQGHSIDDLYELNCKAWQLEQVANILDGAINEGYILTDTQFYEYVSLVNRLAGIKYTDISQTLTLSNLTFTNEFSEITTILNTIIQSIPAGSDEEIQYNKGNVFSSDAQFLRHTVEKAITHGNRAAGIIGTNSFVSGSNSIAAEANSVSFGIGNLVDSDAGFIIGINSINSSNNGFVGGKFTKAIAPVSFVFGEGFDSTKPILSTGANSYILSRNTTIQTIGHGVLSDDSGILFGIDHNIPSDSLRTAIIGGDAIKADATRSNVVYVPELISVSGNIDLGQSSLVSTGVNIKAKSSSTNVPITFTPKGTGTLKTPVGYDSNITANEDIVNKKYVDSFISVGIVDEIQTSDGSGSFKASEVTATNTLLTLGLSTSASISKAITVNGTNTDIDLVLKSKGVGNVLIHNGNTVTNSSISLFPTSIKIGQVQNGGLIFDSSGAFTLGSSATTGTTRSITVNGTGTNIDLLLTPKGTGVTKTSRLGFDLTTGDISTPLEGQIWYNNTTNKFRAFENAAAIDLIPASATASGATGDVQYKSSGGILEGESAFNYDTVNNALLVGTRSGATGANSNIFGTTLEASGIASFASGDSNTISGDYSVGQGQNIIVTTNFGSGKGKFITVSGQGGFGGGQGFDATKSILASGVNSFIYSQNTTSQVAGQGALAANSVLLGGVDNNIATGNIRTVLLGGNGINLTGTTYLDHTVVDNFAIFSTPSCGTTEDVLVRDGTTGVIKKVTQASIGGEINTTSNLGGGQNISSTKVGVDFPFKTLIQGTGITMTSTANEITINSTAVSTHNLLSTKHGDTTPATVSRGSLIVGKQATTVWEELTLGTIGQTLESNGTDLLWINNPNWLLTGTSILTGATTIDVNGNIVTFKEENTSTATVQGTIDLVGTSTGTMIVGFGVRQRFVIGDIGGNFIAGVIDVTMTDVTASSEDSKISFQTLFGGVTGVSLEVDNSGLMLGNPSAAATNKTISVQGNSGNADLILASKGTGGVNVGISGGKLGFFDVTNIVRQTTTSQTPATFVANTSAIVDDTATWNGYTIGDLVAILQAYGILT